MPLLSLEERACPTNLEIKLLCSHKAPNACTVLLTWGWIPPICCRIRLRQSTCTEAISCSEAGLWTWWMRRYPALAPRASIIRQKWARSKASTPATWTLVVIWVQSACLTWVEDSAHLLSNSKRILRVALGRRGKKTRSDPSLASCTSRPSRATTKITINSWSTRLKTSQGTSSLTSWYAACNLTSKICRSVRTSGSMSEPLSSQSGYHLLASAQLSLLSVTICT